MNKFDSANFPTSEPDQLVIGDRWMWKRTDIGTDYDPSAYTLKYTLRKNGDGASEIDITATGSGTEYLIEVASATTTAYQAGHYTWQAYITRNSDSQRIMILSGSVEVVANRDAATTDPRTHARKVLDAIEAVIEERATKDQESYTINGRSLARTPIVELLRLRDRYKTEVEREKIAEKLAAGKHTPRTIRVRF